MTLLAADKVENPILYSGAIETCEKWKPHWGISHDTLSGYATIGKIAFLLRNDFDFAITVTSTGNFTVKIYGDGGELSSASYSSTTVYTFDHTSYSDPFPDTDGCNGYGTYIMVLSAATSLSTVVVAQPSTNSTTHYPQACLWAISNSTTCNSIRLGNSGTVYCRYLECAEFLDSVTYGGGCFYSCNNLRRVLNYNRNSNQSNYLNYALIEHTGQSSATDMQYDYASCYCLEKIDLTNPNLKNFTNNTNMYSLTSFRLRKSNFRAGTGTVFNISNARSMTATALGVLSEDIGRWEILQWGITNGYYISAWDNYTSAQIRANLDGRSIVYTSILSSKTFVFTGSLGAATFDATPLSAIGATITR